MIDDAPTEKEVRYDRQLRLWGDHGQQDLERARVCLLNATATGTEILKSLVLPGIGSFVIIDDHLVTGEDVGNNFFLEHRHINESRAKVACELLKELNPEVKGDCILQNPSALLAKKPEEFAKFNVVIGTALSESLIRELGALLYRLRVPFVVVRAYGLFGSIRIQVSNHVIVESHPDNEFPDLRLDCPFPVLKAFVAVQDLTACDHEKHSHTPYVVLYFKALEAYRAQGKGNFPHSYAEKKAFKEILLAMRKPDDKGSIDEENFAEAVAHLNASLTLTSVPKEVAKILSDPAIEEIKALSELTRLPSVEEGEYGLSNGTATPELDGSDSVTAFWVLCLALQQFVNERGTLPLRGSLPDMISDSARYVELHQIYRDQASADAGEIMKSVESIAAKLGLAETSANGPSLLDVHSVRRFCKNAAFLRLIRGRSLEAEFTDHAWVRQVIEKGLSESDPQIFIYILLRAAVTFHKQQDRSPGTNGIPADIDQRDLQKRADKFLAEIGLAGKWENADFVQEICRYGGAELHAVAAFLGGIAAQEVIKLITRQYVPLNNTFIFNGITMNGSTYEF